MNGHNTIWRSLWRNLPLRSRDLVDLLHDLLHDQINYDTRVGSL